MKKRPFLLVFLVVPLLGSCAQIAPMYPKETTCDLVRDQVRHGMPVDLALRWYPECAPFQVPNS